ncbi:hypothetical protein VYU27_005815, partial [Nannochloropsis oceanica]
MELPTSQQQPPYPTSSSSSSSSSSSRRSRRLSSSLLVLGAAAASSLLLLPSTTHAFTGSMLGLRRAAISSSSLLSYSSRTGAGALTAFLRPFASAPAAARQSPYQQQQQQQQRGGRPSSLNSYRGGGGGRGRGSYGGGGGRGRGPQVDDFKSFGEEMTFDTTTHDDGNDMLVADKRVSPGVVEALAQANITHFTPIQRETYDPLFDGRDMIGRSRTGTGKTLAFGLPICEVVAKNLEAEGRKNERGRAPSVIILAPTRELAKQCDDQLSRIGRPLGLWIRTIYGGVPYERQIRDLESGFDVLVGTPGRIMDHLNRGTLSLKDI